MKSLRTSCGVIISDREHILLGHATRSPRWDIPKGEAEPGEDSPPPQRGNCTRRPVFRLLRPICPAWRPHLSARQGFGALCLDAPLPCPIRKSLYAARHFTLPNGTVLPEFDRFALFTWDESLSRVGKNMSRVLAQIGPETLLRASK